MTILKFSQANNYLACINLLESVLVQLLSVYLIYRHNYWGSITYSLTMVRIFIQMHDMAHYSFFKSNRFNNHIGQILGILTFMPLLAWKNGHNHHHKHFGNLDKYDASQTILFTKKEYDSMPKFKKLLIRIFRDPFVFFTLSIPFLWFFGSIFYHAKKYGISSTVTLQKFFSFLYAYIMIKYFHIPCIPFLVAIYMSAVIGGILFHLQHSVNIPYRKRNESWNKDVASLEGSTFLVIPFPLSFFTNGIEFHHIHHQNTMVPCYHLSKCHHSINYKEWEMAGVIKVNMKLAFQSLSNVMLDEDKNFLISF
jgi:omega-6 fatty acid desaturase (delta-12 desaturase)